MENTIGRIDSSMKSLKRYLLEQEVLNKLDALQDEVPEEEEEFNLKGQEKLPQEGIPTGMYRRYLGMLTKLPPPTSPRYQRWILDMVLRWLKITDISDLNRTERPVRSYIRGKS